MNKKRIIKTINETLLSSLFLFVLGQLFLTILHVMEDQSYRKNIIAMLSAFVPAIYTSVFYGPFILLAIPFFGLVNYSIDRLCEKHSFSLFEKNRSTFFNFIVKSFFNFFIFLALITIAIFSMMGIFFLIKIKIKGLKIEELTDFFLIWILFSIFSIYLFYFLADKIIFFYKKKKAIKT